MPTLLRHGATALAQVNAALSLILAVQGSALATAAAGASSKLQFKPDHFSQFGFIFDAAAYAEASAGFGLAVGLDAAMLAQWANDNLRDAGREAPSKKRL